MKEKIKIFKNITMLCSGIIWGIISVYWVGFSIMFAGNLMEEPGSYHYEEAESFRFFGVIGLVIYIVLFGFIISRIKDKKKTLFIFLLSMVMGGMGICYRVFL
ncbi:MAG: hypothetical protein J1E62_01960 [Lachnospiraceae bacterium]|nr:hypothetical protein [Lachnospiraceae bacterium]